MFIEEQAKKSHLLATAIVDVQNSSGQTPAVTSRDTHISAMRRQQFEYNLNRFWEVEPVEQSSMTAEQACEEHFLIYTTQPRWNPITLGLSSLQNEDYMQLTQAGKSSRTQGSISQFHEEI